MNALGEIPGLNRVRKHHAVEHATIAVLFQRRGRVVSVLGRSDLSGFHVYGPFAADEVESALAEALKRLRAGEHELAVSNFCGTNLATSAILAGSAALVAHGRGERRSWSRAMSAAILATIAAAPVGRWIQRHLTTDADIGNLRLDHLRDHGGTGPGRHVKIYLRS